MNATPERRAEAIFYGALDLLRSERDGFLSDACGADAALRAEVGELLQMHDCTAGFLREDAPSPADLETQIFRLKAETTGEHIGPYKLMEKIGEGGFGTVWVAEQEKPVRRRVALKVIKPGMDTKAVIARFEQERQALAMMDHPNIARVFDAGATPLGRPYFVMELVRGVNITKHCDQANLTTTARLQLFITVCHAVQHAHQKGIIHRDLKPSNILVTLHDGVPVPKVIDFGVAKATQQQRLTDLTIYTQFEQMIGTPLYMSPEQAEMSSLDIDTRSDIYSLGVLLYELLAGRTPFDPETLMKAGFDEMRRVIREQEPQRPSTFVSTMAAAQQTDLAQHRQTDGNRLIGQIRGDLDWIVMKALEKDRARRYESATGLAQDIQRHLVSEPVQARPPTRAYRFRRFAKRNKFALAAAGAVLAVLLTGLGVSTWMYFKERDARERAVAAEQSQSQVAKILRDMLSGVGPAVSRGSDITMLRDILDRTAERIGKDLKAPPPVEAELQLIIGNVYSELGEYGKADTALARALGITRRLRGEKHPEVAIVLNERAKVLSEEGHLEEAEAMHREALAIRRALPGGGPGADVTSSLSNLALVVAERGRLAEAEAINREVLAMNKRIKGDEHEIVALSLNNLASVLEAQDKFDEAEPMLREALAMQRKLPGDTHPDLASTLNNLANVVQKQSKLTDSEALFREVLTLQRKLLGNAHPNVAAALNGLGLALHKQGNNKEAETLLREGMAIERKVRKSAHPQMATLMGNLGRVMEGQGEYAEAESLFREALTICRNLPGDAHPDAVSWRNRLSGVLEAQRKWADLETMAREDVATEHRGVPQGEPHPDVAAALKDLATTLYNQRKAAEAEPYLREAVEMYRKLLPGTDPQLARALGALGGIMDAQQKYAEAESHYREAHTIFRKGRGNENGFISNWHSNLATVVEKQGKYPEAQSMRREAVEAVRKLTKPDAAQLEPALSSLSENLYRQNKFAEAEPLLREMIESLQARLGKENNQLPGPLCRLGRLLADWAWSERSSAHESGGRKTAERAREAERLLRECSDERRGTSAGPQDSNEVRNRLGGALVAVAVTDPTLTNETRLAKLTEAEPLLLHSNEVLQQSREVESNLKRDSLMRLVHLYDAWEKPEKAAIWQQELADLDTTAAGRDRTPNADSPQP